MAASDAGRTSSAIVGSFRGEAAPSRAQYAKSPDRLARRDCAGKQIIVIFDHAGRDIAQWLRAIPPCEAPAKPAVLERLRVSGSRRRPIAKVNMRRQAIWR